MPFGAYTPFEDLAVATGLARHATTAAQPRRRTGKNLKSRIEHEHEHEHEYANQTHLVYQWVQY
jgi:hypothetical protein